MEYQDALGILLYALGQLVDKCKTNSVLVQVLLMVQVREAK